MKSLPLLAFVIVAITGALAADSKKAADAPAPKIHPKVFSMIGCWISDSESPVVTEINLDAVAQNGNQFSDDGLKQKDGWTRCPGEGGKGFLRYRFLETKGKTSKVEFQDNGGGTLTSASIIEFSIEKREVRKDGKPVTVRVLRVLGVSEK